MKSHIFNRDDFTPIADGSGDTFFDDLLRTLSIEDPEREIESVDIRITGYAIDTGYFLDV